MKTDIVPSFGSKNGTLLSATNAHSEAAHTCFFQASDVSSATIGYLIKTASEEVDRSCDVCLVIEEGSYEVLTHSILPL